MLAEMGLTLGKILSGSCKLVATTASCGRKFHNVRFVKKYFLSLMCPESSSVQLWVFTPYSICSLTGLGLKASKYSLDRAVLIFALLIFPPKLAGFWIKHWITFCI
ncbi:Hypothetical predicted protein [Podarcis lilfordi]|uniref:Uncharacterized protein n=1 Tax=Podarcis lilfordi TaxID=74358 RepID=A0AA35VPU1_9SAUR|nr:Hypothetical predicted protein [Podarcis lilfordi]